MSSRGTVGGVLLATAVALGAQACAQVLGLEEAVVIEEAAGGAGVGAGGSVPQCTTPLDCPMDTTCMPATCQASKCGFTAAPEGTVCFAENAGKVCDGKGKCVECTQEVHCPVEWLCDTDANQCVALPCLNGKRDGEESDIDCGGPSCPKCAIAGACQTGDDCASGYCSTKTHKCVETHCDDSTKNADETDVDCGGPSCPKCATDKGCLSGGDCVDGVCGSDPKICLPHTCSDSVKNGSETDVDCGGSCPAGCANGQGCAQPVDCASGFCNATKHVCVATKCEDGLKNGLETDVDCGGGACPLCATGKACSKGADCASTFCNETKHLCVATQCEDGLKNGSETDVDCGGSCPAKCANCKACLVAGDCASG
ncbi:MAG: hypothetical protein HY744_00200, partial [Deltaproteobacteria bacterium]|nr:hypothetical protein [Deltaproteobacteria bacterium]